jgi:uncharacterized membrane protein YedE/YeeE
MMRLIAPALSGLLFALGLGLAGMTDPARVLAFLDFAGSWDPSLAFVMAGAMTTYGLARVLVLKRTAPIDGGSFPVFPKSRPDGRLVAGAALFGVGWGLGGWCPGPAFVSIAGGAVQLLAFVAAMVAGMGLFALWQRRSVARSGVVEPPCPT